MGKVVKILISIILIFFAVPYVAYGTFKYMQDEQPDTVKDIEGYMEDIYGFFPNMDKELGAGVEFIGVYDYTMFYGWMIAIVSFILGMFANAGGSKTKKKE